jgi:phage terminase small subunit
MEKVEIYTPEQRAFVLNFIEQGFKNAGGAYRRAYPKCKTENSANVSASQLLRRPKIHALIKDEMDRLMDGKKEFLEHQIFNFWFVRMTYDPTEVIGLDGRLKITEEELRKKGLHVCIDSVNEKITSQGDRYLEYKLADRDKAADMLSRYIQMIKPPAQVNMNFQAGETAKMTAEEEAEYQRQLAAIRGK